MAQQSPDCVDLDHLLQAICDGMLLHPTHAGAVRIVIESEAGEPLHVVKIDDRRPAANKAALPPRPRPSPLAELIVATSAVQADGQEQRDAAERDLLLMQQCNEQQQRITELEQRLQQMQQELDRHAGPQSPAQLVLLSPASSTDEDSNNSSDSPHRSDDDDLLSSTSLVAMTDGTDDTPSSSMPSPPVSDHSTAVRKSERPKNNIKRWNPSAQHETSSHTARSASALLHKKRQTKRRRQAHIDEDDGEQSISSDTQRMEVDSSDYDDDEDDAVEVAALVVKLREGYDKRQSVSLDSVSKESVVSLRQQVLEKTGDLVASTVSGQITSLINTSTSLKMVGYYLRAVLAHRLKVTSKKCYKRLVRDTLGVKSPTDIAAYPALYELVQHHYPNLASATVEAWLENSIFTTDLTWTEWKRYLTKPGRPIIDAALQRFKDATAPFQNWMQLGWVEIYDDDKLGQGVRAVRDIHMPASKAKEAQRDVAASISVVAADLHCAGPEFVMDKDAAREADATYLVQLDRHRVFDARHHWVGKINHLPDRLCNLRLANTGKLAQTKAIEAGEVLTFDYGADYWVYQLSGLELSEWLVSSSVQSSRGVVDLFGRMHDSVLDYKDLLSCDWVRRRPAAWSELERETWMGNLAEYMEGAARENSISFKVDESFHAAPVSREVAPLQHMMVPLEGCTIQTMSRGLEHTTSFWCRGGRRWLCAGFVECICTLCPVLREYHDRQGIDNRTL